MSEIDDLLSKMINANHPFLQELKATEEALAPDTLNFDNISTDEALEALFGKQE